MAKAKKKPRLQVFISHASADTEVAKTLARFLEDRGAKVISDSNIRPSESFLDEIEQAIKTSRVVTCSCHRTSSPRPGATSRRELPWDSSSHRQTAASCRS
jgi:TIR domain